MNIKTLGDCRKITFAIGPHQFAGFLLRDTIAGYSSTEYDIYVYPHVLNKILKVTASSELLVDFCIENSPHCKITYFTEYQEPFSIDLVSKIEIFSKSRGICLEKKSLGKSIFSFSNEYYYIFLILHSIFDKSIIYPSKYYHILSTIRPNLSPINIDKALSNLIIPKSLFYEIERNFFLRRAIRLRLLSRIKMLLLAMVLKPRDYVFHILKSSVRLFKHFQKKFFSEKIIVFMGPDGSGKTSLIQEIIKSDAINRWEYIHLGNKSNVLPTTKILNFLREKKRLKRSRVSSSDVSSANTEITQFARKSALLIVFWKKILNFILITNQYLEIFSHIQLIRFRNLLLRNKTHLIIDRYIYDMYISKVSLFLFYFYPSPDLIINLTAPTDVLLSRKSEHSREVIESFLSRYESFSKNQRFSPLITLNTNQCISKLRIKLLRIIQFTYA